MVCWHASILLYIVYILVPVGGVDPSCECVVFQSHGLSEGYFHSPNYPRFYKPGINCILYTFIGDVNEIVEIKFIAMDLKHALRISLNASQCTDFIRLYTNLERAEVNEHSLSEDELCGDMADLDEKVFFSTGRALILEFHSDHETKERHTGFNGSFAFRGKQAFKTDGIARYDTRCQYDIISYNNGTRGKFFSPRYPQKYPHSTYCQYLFIGQDTEKVRVVFTVVRLPKHSKICDGDGDVIRVYDGKNNSSALIKTFCNAHNNTVELVSSGLYMYIEFQSDKQYEKQGFAAEYHFVDAGIGYPFSSPSNDVPANTPNVHNCNQSIISDSHSVKKNGTISSPNYPSSYQPNIKCEYEFIAQDKERIQIQFTNTSLFYSLNDPEDTYGCSTQDSVKVLVYANNKEEDSLGEFCGKNFPSQLMSNGQRLKLRFKSEEKSKKDTSGFRVVYTFRTDFGVLGNGVQNDNKECKFIYNSSKASSGEFTSPNYHGLYPRNTECSYSFHGKSKEIVNITFEKFQLYGCDEPKDTDLVTFSNFINAEDRKMRRFCGSMIGYDNILLSDGPFFRVTFKSNDKYEAEGFKGLYTFKMVTNDVTLAQSSQNSISASSELKCQDIIFVVTVMYLFTTL